MKQLLVFVLVAAAACGKSKSECRAEADALTALLAQADTGDSRFYIDDNSGLVTRTDLPQRPTSNAPIVSMNATETVYEGWSATSDNELRERLAAAVAKITEDIELGRLRAAQDPKQIYFLIHAATPWSRVAAAVKTAGEAGLVAPMFVFAHPMTAKPPPRTAVDTELDAIKDRKGASKATTLANLMSAQIKGCPALIRVMGEIAGDESSGKTKEQMLLEKLAPALVECECAVNYPELRSVLWHLLVSPTPTRVVVTDPAAPKETIAFPAATTWGEASKRLTAATKGVDFVVE